MKFSGQGWRIEQRVRLWLSVVFLLLGSGVLMAAVLPLPRIQQVLPLQPVVLPTPTLVSGPVQTVPILPRTTLQPALLDNRQLVLEWSKTVREQDSSLITLPIRIDNPNRALVNVPDLYATHNVVAMARLDMVGIEANQAEILAPMTPGKPVRFRWNIRANQGGLYRGVLWLHLQLVPKNGGSIDEMLVLAHPIEIQVVTIMGLSENQARILGEAGLSLSVVIGYPLVKGQIGQWLNRFIGRRKPPSVSKEVRKSIV